jgi:leukotriene A-4 hydrolase/aminopeptidase
MDQSSIPPAQDNHSYANTAEVRVTHVALDLDVDFAARRLVGTATLELAGTAAAVVLDTRELEIAAAETSPDGETFAPAQFQLGQADPILGSPLTVTLAAGTSHVRVRYATSPQASGLQWLEPAQTAGGKEPYLFSQSQAIHARSWIPLQDTPSVRAPYSAVIRTPPSLRAVMSASNDPDAPRTGEYRFEMPQAIPSYLIALAVGDIAFEPMSERTGVYAEPSVVKAAASEFSDTERMMQAVESMFGPYRWGRYDILVLPPSFPFGGMENPRLTFATPTLIAGDRSLVGVIAHELAHSWSGNLVTNATWRDFWLNEGFTVYLENRIQEAVFGEARGAMEAALEVTGLREEMATLPEPDQILHVDLAGRDPDDGFTQVPYVKGMLLLRTLEATVGRERWDAFLRGYFDHFAFQSITTADFLAYLRENLPDAANAVDLAEWTTKPGLPADAVLPQSDALTQVDAAQEAWLAGQNPASAIPLKSWSTQETLHFLTTLPADLSVERMADLDAAFALSQAQNAEIISRWLLESVKRGYQPAYARLEPFLTSVGRRKFLEPLYRALAATPDGKKLASEIYAKARPGYHPIAQATVDKILAED